MKLILSLAATAFAAQAAAAAHPFNVHDLMMLDRASDPQVSPDGKWIAVQMRRTDYEANKGVNAIWLMDSAGKYPQLVRLTDDARNATSPRWAPDGSAIYFLGKGDGSDSETMQLWRQGLERIPDPRKGRSQDNMLTVPSELLHLPLDVNNFKFSPDGKRVLLSIDVFADCADLACTKKRLDDKAKDKASGMLFDKLFIRHWDTWADGRRSQLFIADVPDNGKAFGEPRLLSKGIDGDIPSKPFGDDSEFAFSPDGKTVYFDVRIAGKSEPWSTNFDIYSVPADGSAAPKNLTASNQAWDAYPVPSPDGKTLYYLAMKRATFEADRFGIMALDLGSGKSRELDPQWDRSPGGLQVSNDGKVLYATADDNGQHPLFAIDVASGKPTQLTGPGNVDGYSVGKNGIVFARNTLKSPTDLFSISASGGKETQLTHLNAERLADTRMGDVEWYSFKGAKGDDVHGYVVKPVDFVPGKKYPVAFLVHGGPQGSWVNDFHYRWNPQVYAGAGFAVVTVDFHGSTGYGQAFTDAISGDWGGAPLEDLQKGWAAALQKYTFLDGNRACELGASYGGYMTYWIAGNWNQPWKCLVAHDGVFDNRAMAYSTEELWFDEWENKGTQWEKPENYEKFNPLDHVKDWRVPILVIHGEKDYRIPSAQGIAAFTAAQRRGIPSEFLDFPDENHWVLKPQNSVLWHDTVLGWLKKYTQ
jgi:dipeptidyl aminopeptidase/acylaminoacyl peptidase